MTEKNGGRLTLVGYLLSRLVLLSVVSARQGLLINEKSGILGNEGRESVFFSCHCYNLVLFSPASRYPITYVYSDGWMLPILALLRVINL
jgi:hypothetical protein